MSCLWHKKLRAKFKRPLNEEMIFYRYHDLIEHSILKSIYSTKKHFGQNPPHTVLPNRMLDDIFRNAYICEENCTWRSWTEKVKSSQHEKQNFKTKIKKKISKVYFLNCELLCAKQRSSHKCSRFQAWSKMWGNTWASIRSVIKFYDYNHAQIHHFTAQFPVSDT